MVGPPLRFGDIVSSPDVLMGVKAVWGRSQATVMCFGSRGSAQNQDRAHFAQARSTAERSIAQPYFVTIGGGSEVSDELRGRVLELVRSTGVYGNTSAFVKDAVLLSRLQQWPVAVVTSEVFSVVGEPRLVEDLGFPDRKILANAYDSVIRDDAAIQRLWSSLSQRHIQRRWDVKSPEGFRDPGKVQMYGSLYPRVTISSSEGKRVWKEALAIETDPRLKKMAKDQNRERNSGRLVCEGCGFSDSQSKMFDAHHRRPLAAGVRQTIVDDLAILCPTCHRWVHSKAADKLEPLTIEELRLVRAPS